MILNRKITGIISAALLAVSAAPSVCAYYDEYGNYYGEDYGYDTGAGYDTGYDAGYTEEYTEEPIIAVGDGPADSSETDDSAAVTTSPLEAYDPNKAVGNEVTSFDTNAARPGAAQSTTAATKVYVSPGEVKDGMVSVDLKIEANEAFKEAVVSISYDSTTLVYDNSVVNPQVGGKTTQNGLNGKYVFNYSNDMGTTFQGTYVTVNFKVVNPDMVSTPLFVSVTTLNNKAGTPIAYSAINGIIGDGSIEDFTDPNAPVEEAPEPKVIKVKVPLRDQPFSMEDFGFADVYNVIIDDPTILEYREGVVYSRKLGTTKVDIVHSDTKIDSYEMTVYDASVPAQDTVPETQIATDAQGQPASVPNDQGEDTGFKKDDRKIRNLIILGSVMLGIVILIIEYIVIVKPFNKGNDFFDDEEYDDNDPEMLADLQKAFEARKAKKDDNADYDDDEYEEEYEEEYEDEEPEAAEPVIPENDDED